jgi:catechol 2,3-dioxygenase-like lactoylglutathione lyase family enzyme
MSLVSRIDRQREGFDVALLQGIETVYYRICNMEKAVAFYNGVLGLTLKNRAGNDWAEFDVGGYDLALEGELATRPHQGGAVVVFRCDDVAALDAHLATHEVQRGDLEDLEGSKLLEFYDPDGNKLIAMQSL